MNFQAFLIRLRVLLATRASRAANAAKRRAIEARSDLIDKFCEQRRQQTQDAWDAASEAADYASDLEATQREDELAFLSKMMGK